MKIWKLAVQKWPRPHLPRPIITPSLMIFKCVYITISHLRVSTDVRTSHTHFTERRIGPHVFEFRRFQFHRCVPVHAVCLWKPQQLSQEVLELVNLQGRVTESWGSRPLLSLTSAQSKLQRSFVSLAWEITACLRQRIHQPSPIHVFNR